MGKFGTLNVLEDLVDANDPVFGNEDVIAQRFSQALEVYNTMFRDMVDPLVWVTDRAQLPTVGTDTAIVQELDEWGRADASKAGAPGQVGFPLRLWGSTVQWTNTYFQRAKISEMAAQLDAHAAADLKNFQDILRTVLFKPTNTASYFDRLDTKLTYALRALVNADSQPIPISPNGTVFDASTHTHYLASATYTQAAAIALIDTVVEHGVEGEIQFWIAKADEATVRGFANFSPYMDARITVAAATQIGNQALDVSNPDNRAIGVLNGAEVWVKPWIPQNYGACVDVGASLKPLGVRTRSGDLTSGLGAFALRDEHSHHPLHAQALGREFGVAAYGRWKAAVSKFNNAAYSAPS